MRMCLVLSRFRGSAVAPPCARDWRRRRRCVGLSSFVTTMKCHLACELGLSHPCELAVPSWNNARADPRPPPLLKFASGQHSADSRRSTLTPRADPHDTQAHMTKPRPPSGPMGPFCALWISFALFHRPSLTGRATIGRLELPPGEGRFVDPPPTCGLCSV